MKNILIIGILIITTLSAAHAQGIKPKQLQNADSISSILLSDSNKRYQHADINDVITYDTIAGRDRVTQGHILLAGVDQETDTVKYYVSGLTTVQSGTDNQELNLDLNTNILSLERGSHVDLTLYRNGQPLDTFTIVNDSIRISVTNDQVGFFSVDLAPYLDNTDDQTVDTFTIVSNVLRLSVEGDGQAYKSVNLAPYLDNTDDQVIDTFTIVSNVLRLSVEGDGQAYKSVNLAPYLDNTDNQDLSLTANILSLTNDATTVDLSPYLDNTVLSQEQVQDYVGSMVSNNIENGITVDYNDNFNRFDFSVTDQSTSNELQTISTTGAAGNISLSNGGGTLNLNVNDADASTTNELQNIDVYQLVGTDLQLSLSDDATLRTIDLSSLAGGGDNIYSTDGTLTADRTVYLGTNDLTLYKATTSGSVSEDLTFTLEQLNASYDTYLRMTENGSDTRGGYIRWESGGNTYDIGTNSAGDVNAIQIPLGSTQVKLPGYTGSTHDGTPTKDIGVDASGNLVTFTVPSGGSSIWTDGGSDIYWTRDPGDGVSIHGTQANGELDIFGDNTDAPSVSIVNSSGLIFDGDNLGQLLFDGVDGRSVTSVDAPAMIRATSAGSMSTTSKGAYLRFYTKTTSTAHNSSAIERFRIGSTGSINFYSGSSGSDFTINVADDYFNYTNDDIIINAGDGIALEAGSTVSGGPANDDIWLAAGSEIFLDVPGAGTIWASEAISISSDERLKDNIKEIKSLDKINQLVPVSYSKKADSTNATHYGLIAQDVERIYPEIVTTGDDGMKAVAYTELIAPLIRAIQEQQVQINALQKEIKELKKDK